MRATGGAASPPAAWEPKTGFTLEWCAGRVKNKRALSPPFFPSQISLRFLWVLSSHLCPSHVSDISRRWRSAASRGCPSCRHRWGQAVGPLPSVAPRSSDGRVAPSGHAPTPPNLDCCITSLKGRRRATALARPASWRRPRCRRSRRRRPPSTPVQEALLTTPNAGHAVTDDCGCGAGGVSAGRAWRRERVKIENVGNEHTHMKHHLKCNAHTSDETRGVAS